MTDPDSAGWDQPGDDGVLDDSDTLASDDMTRDRLDAGIDPPEQYSVAEGWGNTESEARQGESLEQQLTEEEPEQSSRAPASHAAAPEAGQLIADGPGGASPGTAAELPGAVPDGERDAEQGAMHIHNTHTRNGSPEMTHTTTRRRAASTRLAPSGRQFTISHGAQHATIVEVGGGLRRYRVEQRDLLDGYVRTERCTGARGLPLIPWPNRIQDGSYTFDGVNYQVPLTEPDNHNAIHGFLRWRNWTCRLSSGNRVVMGTVLHPQMGYPFALDVSVDYRLDDDGLSVRTTATNIGDQPCPYGTGQHPYLSLGTDLIDPCELRLDAGQWLPTDDRGLPTGHATVAGSDRDFRRGRQIGAQDIDSTFTDLARDENGRAWVLLLAPDGAGLRLWVDQAYPFIEIYTAHTQPDPHRRTGLGVEPMTCAPNAFASGDGLIRLEPGESTGATWGLRTTWPMNHASFAPTDM